jgi:hypothetical protein
MATFFRFHWICTIAGRIGDCERFICPGVWRDRTGGGWGEAGASVERYEWCSRSFAARRMMANTNNRGNKQRQWKEQTGENRPPMGRAGARLVRREMLQEAKYVAHLVWARGVWISRYLAARVGGLFVALGCGANACAVFQVGLGDVRVDKAQADDPGDSEGQRE